MAYDAHPPGRNGVPVLDPVRVMLIDPDLPRRAALTRALDLDPDLAVVASTADVRAGVADVAWATPDLVVIGLSPDDDRCAAIVARLAAAPAILILGIAPGGAPAAASAGYIRELAEQVRAAGLSGKRGRAPARTQRPVMLPVLSLQ